MIINEHNKNLKVLIKMNEKNKKEEINGISQKDVYKNFSKIDENVFKKVGISKDDLDWIKKELLKIQKDFCLILKN